MANPEGYLLEFDGDKFSLSNEGDANSDLRLHAFGTRGQASAHEAQARFALRVTAQRQWLQRGELSAVEGGEVDGRLFRKAFSYQLDSFMHAESSWNAVCYMMSQLDGVGNSDAVNVEFWCHSIDHFSTMAALTASNMGCRTMVVVVEISV